MRMFRHILLLTAVLLTVSCSSDSTLSEEKVIDTRTPMVFGTSYAQADTEVTRASSILEADFKVGVWKAFGAADQQTVMDGYKVDYNATATNKWNYVDIQVTGKPQQVERYWDLSAFPYEFRAVSPYLTDTEATVTPTGITITKPFQAQKMTDTGITPSDGSSEACVVAHVKRVKSGADYVDTDVIEHQEINTTGQANATREVHLPFHHLISKVGFRIYIDNPSPFQSDYSVSLQSIRITAKNATTGFIYGSSTYTATDALAAGVFSNNSTTANEHDLLNRTTPYTETIGGVTKNLDFHNHLNRAQAFDLTPGCLHQIPQENVKLHVQLTMHSHHVESEDQKFTYDSWLSLDRNNNTENQCDVFTWEREKRYIYYLHIPNLHGHDILLETCEILPWGEVESNNIDIKM